MLVVDTSVVIDRLRDSRTPQTLELDKRIGLEPVLLGDVVLMEVLQGTRDDAHAMRVTTLLKVFKWVEMFDEEIALRASDHFRALRSSGCRLRSQIDLMIGTYCIRHEHELLHADRDYDAMSRHLGLRVADVSLPPH